MTAPGDERDHEGVTPLPTGCLLIPTHVHNSPSSAQSSVPTLQSLKMKSSPSEIYSKIDDSMMERVH